MLRMPKNVTMKPYTMAAGPPFVRAEPITLSLFSGRQSNIGLEVGTHQGPGENSRGRELP